MNAKITSSQISSHTTALMKDYQALTGRRSAVDISEFLLLRAQAIQEIEAGYVEEGVAEEESSAQEYGEAPVKKAVTRKSRKKSTAVLQERQETQIDVNAEVVPAKKEASNVAPLQISMQNNLDPEHHSSEQAEDNEAKSGFDILRSLEDNWN